MFTVNCTYKIELQTRIFVLALPYLYTNQVVKVERGRRHGVGTTNKNNNMINVPNTLVYGGSIFYVIIKMI